MLTNIPASPAAIRASWDAQLASYQQLRAASDAMDDNDRRKNADGAWLLDLAVDAYCEAMDQLIEKTAAPDATAVLLKLRLAWERGDAFVGGIFDDHRAAILADLDRLAAAEAMPPAAMPAWEVYSEAARAVAEAESDIAMTPQQRADRALDCHRAWRRWMEAMDRATGTAARLQLLSGGREAA